MSRVKLFTLGVLMAGAIGLIFGVGASPVDAAQKKVAASGGADVLMCKYRFGSKDYIKDYINVKLINNDRRSVTATVMFQKRNSKNQTIHLKTPGATYGTREFPGMIRNDSLSRYGKVTLKRSGKKAVVKSVDRLNLPRC